MQQPKALEAGDEPWQISAATAMAALLAREEEGTVIVIAADGTCWRLDLSKQKREGSG